MLKYLLIVVGILLLFVHPLIGGGVLLFVLIGILISRR